jgi:hypothetical protein
MKRLLVHLKPLEWKGVLELWNDTLIKPGSTWREEIGEAIQSAKVAVLLISADFLASDFIMKNELPPLLAAADKDEAIILPILISPSQFEQVEELYKFQAVNPPSHTLIKMGRVAQEEMFVKVANVIGEALGEQPSKVTSPDITEGREAYGNRQGVASGPVVHDEASIGRVFHETGKKVILMTADPHLNLPFDKIAGLIFVGNLTDLSHLSLTLNELQIPVVFAGEPPKLQEGARIAVDSNRKGSVDKLITFTTDFIYTKEREYSDAVGRNIRAGIKVPPALMAAVLEEHPPKPSGEMISWAHSWGPIHEITRNVLPVVGREYFDDVAVICENLCSEYQWPVGRQEARRVLPQLAYYRRKETLSLLKSWVSSGRLYLVKSSAMALGNVAFMDLPLARAMLKTILDHPNDTVAKEAARAVPSINDVDPDLANHIVGRCSSFKSIPEIADYRSMFYGLALAAIPGYLTLSKDLTFEKVEYAAKLISGRGVADPNLAVARNYIFANVLLLAEADPTRLTATMVVLQPFTMERHIQVDLLVAAARLAQCDKKTARELFKLAAGHLDDSLSGFSEQIREKLLS